MIAMTSGSRRVQKCSKQLSHIGRFAASATLVAAILGSSKAGLAQSCPRELPAFPGAEGFGKFTVGGRGGVVVPVTNLNDSGPGSLRDALTRPMNEPRIVVFRVSGVIVLESQIQSTQSFITIAGETAPGDGVYVRGEGLGFVDASQIIIRNLTVRPGCNPGQTGNIDTIGFARCRNVMVDSCSVSFSTDENLSFVDCDLVTVQWSITSYGLRGGSRSCRSDGRSDHSCGLLIVNRLPGTNRLSLLHNLFAHDSLRIPLVAGQGSGIIQTEIIGNSFYNWGPTGEYGTQFQMCDAANTASIQTHLEGNFFRFGPDSSQSNPVIRRVDLRADPDCDDRGGLNPLAIQLYRSGNRFQTDTELVSDASGPQFYWTFPATGFVVSPSRLFTPAYVSRLGVGDAVAAIAERAGAGAGLIAHGRDAIDTRSVWTFLLHQGGLIDHQDEIFDDLDGNGTRDWPVYRSGVAPVDTDMDGMPDAWEVTHASNPMLPDGYLPASPGGYTRLEAYLHSLHIVRSDAPPPICAADFNCDDTVDFFDYLDFVDAFSSNSPAADFNADGVIDFFDYLDFVDAFSMGC